MSYCNEEGSCVLPEKSNKVQVDGRAVISEHQIIFVTDPICSHCWALEPAWRRLQLEYDITVRYIHGGLLPGWGGFADTANDIAKPEDVIPHWQQVSELSGQPIDPSIWSVDPPANSYVLCKAAIAIRILKPQAESAFVRIMREKVFFEAVNITKQTELVKCAAFVGIEQSLFLQTLKSIEVSEVFLTERGQMHMLGARGFPSVIFLGENPCVVIGSREYEQLEAALLRNVSKVSKARHLSASEKLQSYPSWTITEACQVLLLPQQEVVAMLYQLGFVESRNKYGSIWRQQ